MVDSHLHLAEKRVSGWRRLFSFSLALLGLVCCGWLAVNAVKSGLSQLLSIVAATQTSLDSANVAIKLAPQDPQAHYARALVLINQERLADAIAELDQVTRLRPYHFYEWLDLGVTLDRFGDQTRAEAALRESIRLAPGFDQPRWQLGNLLFRQGRYEEAFAELRIGSKNNPNLIERMLDLAWVAADGDVETFAGLIQPQTGQRHLQLANYLARKEKGADAVHQVKEAGLPGDDNERALLHQTITQLLAARLFPEAYAAWASTHIPADAQARDPGLFLNGDFVDPITQNDPGFGWQVSDTPKVAVSIDPSGPTAGARSLRLAFNGETPAGAQMIFQLILLQPNTRYSLSFMSRAQNLVTGGPPVLRAVDGASKERKILGESKPLSPGAADWSAYQVDFATEENTTAVIISLQRLGCSQTPCPIFGALWLSKFSLAKN